MRTLEEGFLPVGDGNEIWYRTAGSVGGAPVVVLHGGPGSGITDAWLGYFDEQRHFVVLMDQRGAGRSTPSAADHTTDMSVNTTHHLLRDLEQLRRHLGIDRWSVFGLSWGCTLGLAYAESHPDVVASLVLGSVTLTRPSDIDWLYHGARSFFPEAWARFAADSGAPDGADLVASYRDLLEDPDPAVREAAALAWCRWEHAVVGDGEAWSPDDRYADADFRMGFARTVTHYFANRAWLAEDQLLRDAHRLTGTPGALVHGSLDVSSPLAAAWELAGAWPDAELVAVGGEGHTGRGRMGDELVAAVDRLIPPLSP